MIFVLICSIPVFSFSLPAFVNPSANTTNQSENYLHPIQVDGLTLKEYRAGINQREIYTEQAAFAQAENRVNLAQPRFILFDQQGNNKMSLTCEKSWIDLQNNLVYFAGKVSLKTNTGLRFQTEELNWDTAQKKFFTAAAVEIIKDNNILRGTGLEADENFNQIQILHFAAQGSQADFGKGTPTKK
ncbi:MAG: LPS export ABC transporter periplasmic protein LptC [bacterium]|nr:LPS export ABC transporter periplasmic protein LptC [bacterium]